MNPIEAESVISVVTSWAVNRPDVLAFALVGSWARGCARADSDLDLMLLVADPDAYRSDGTWPSRVLWPNGQAVDAFVDRDYGAAWSRHLRLNSGASVEVTFARAQWACVSPLDPGTIEVIHGGLRVLHDPLGLMTNLIDHASRLRSRVE